MNPYEVFADTVFRVVKNEFLPPIRIIHHGPATVVFWKDGTKTVVKLMEGDVYDEYNAFCAAFVKKVYGSTNAVKKAIEAATEAVQ
jgi:hypothetical protein